MTEQQFKAAKRLRKKMRKTICTLANAEHMLYLVENGQASMFMEVPNGKSVETNLKESINELRLQKMALEKEFASV